MPLNVGSRLGHYDVTALIGEGGMGQVYQATDTKLNRQVALKILPEAFATDPDRLARFQREAQVLASLNHPNIAQIHGIEEGDDTRALVLELVEGPTLADRIAQGPIPVDEALPIAKQIAEALEAAHEQGIIHRDLKPANIKVREDGTVKVLDFGLAKALDTTPEGDPSQSPTLTAAATQMGVIMGTAAYMSPEQARGKTVDKRADIWAFGCVLYEMLTGQTAFQGEDVSLTLSAVLQREPKWETLPPEVPFGLGTYVRRCLQKDLTQRVQAIGDMRLALDGAFEPPVSDQQSTRSTSARKIWDSPVPVVVGGVLLMAITAVVVWSLARVPAVFQAQLRFVLANSAVDAIDYGGRSFALSPDGLHLVYLRDENGERRLYHRPLDRIESERLPGTERALDPFFSPDSQWVGFRAGASLRKVSLAGGEPFTLCEQCAPISSSLPGFGEAVFRLAGGATWSAFDDTIIFSNRGALWRVSASGGTPELLAKPDGDHEGAAYLRPSVLPGGRTVLFELRQNSDAPGSVATLSLETGRVNVVADGGTNPEYVATGHLLYTRGDAVFAQPFDEVELEAIGQPVPVLQEVRADLSGSSYFTLSSGGTLVYLPGGANAANKWLVWVDRQGRRSPLVEELSNYRLPRLSPDGSRLVVGEGWERAWVHDLERGGRVRIDGAIFPIWTPDGTRITFVRPPERHLFWKAADGSGDAELLLEGGNIMTSASWSSVGLAFEELNPEGNWDIWVKPNQGELHEFRVTSAHEEAPAFSPDGRYLAYVSEESGRPEVYVRHYPPREGQWPVSTEGGTEPVWSRHGRELFYRHDGGVYAVPIQTTPNFAPGRPKLLFNTGPLEATERQRRPSGDLPGPNPTRSKSELRRSD